MELDFLDKFVFSNFPHIHVCGIRISHYQWHVLYTVPVMPMDRDCILLWLLCYLRTFRIWTIYTGILKSKSQIKYIEKRRKKNWKLLCVHANTFYAVSNVICNTNSNAFSLPYFSTFCMNHHIYRFLNTFIFILRFFSFLSFPFFA